MRHRSAGAHQKGLVRAASLVAEQASVRRPRAQRDEVFRALVENTPDLIARFDRNLRRCYVNPSIERLTGVPAHRLVGRTLAEMHFDERFIQALERALAAAFEGEETTIEVLLPGTSGERVFHSRIVPERDHTGQIEFAMVISRDITDVRRDEERLRALKRDIELLLTSTYEGICAVNLSGSCTFVNASGASMLGYQPEELIGQDIHTLLHSGRAGRDDHSFGECALTGRTVDDGRQHMVDETLRRKDGTSIPVEMFVSPLLEEHGEMRGVVASFVDISERNALKAELELANRLAGLGRIASSMSHEFNNVLMGIQPFAEILLRTSGEARTVDATKRILQSVKRGRAITEGLRTFTRPVDPVRVDTEIGSWLAAQSDALRRLVPPGVQLHVRTPDCRVIANIDPAQVGQVLSSLVMNACDAIGGAGGKVSIDATVVCAAHASAGALKISVTDTGSGVPKEQLSKIFEPFFTTRAGGRGLGLSIAQQIVSRHEGQISVTSEPGHGTSIDIVLPAWIAGKELQQTAAVATERLPRTVLLIEDDEAVAAGICMLLADEGVAATVAGSGADALRSMEGEPPQALVVDVNLPDCNGFELYERIAAQRGRLPVVFISGHAHELSLKNEDTPARVRLLSKPFEMEALLDALAAVVVGGPVEPR